MDISVFESGMVHFSTEIFRLKSGDAFQAKEGN
jgi:hypothetical protein